MSPPRLQPRPATALEWDATWNGCEHATFFHSRAWAEAWGRASGGRIEPDARCFELEDGALVVLPLCRERRSLGLRATISSPAATYGGWLAPRALSREENHGLLSWLSAEFDDLFLKLNPFDPSLVELRLPPTEPDTTQVLDLAPGFEALERSWSKGHRAAAKQAFREGVSLRLARTEEDWRAYYTIYEDSLRRWGPKALARHPWSIFEALRELDSPAVDLWLAEHEGRPVAGALCLTAPRHVVYWHGAVLEDAMELRPVHALIHGALRQACDGGQRHWFDFNPSGPLEGVRAFKKGFGARELACPNLRLQPTWLRLARRVHGALGG